MKSFPVMTPQQMSLLKQIRVSMEQYFGHDQNRIKHALQVASYAEELLTDYDADPILTLTVAYLHDIGIPEAERKHNSSAGKFQELEGPLIAEEILVDLGLAADFIEKVKTIIGKHHTPLGVDSPEFKILWDADALVNFSESFAGKEAFQIETVLQKHMVTEIGYKKALTIFVGEEK